MIFGLAAILKWRNDRRSRRRVVIMHNRETTEPQIDIVADMKRFFARSLEIARRAGVPERHILLDPGIGFGKSREQNYDALRAIPELLALGFPLLIGVSRKSIFKGLGDGVLEGRLVGTLAANLFAARDGAQVFRVHDAAEHRAASKSCAFCRAPGRLRRCGRIWAYSNLGDKPANIARRCG
jgi:dihydropteroate synthase